MILPHETLPTVPEASPDQPLDLALLAKYAVPGPRYTSYPPANRFHDNVGSLDLEEALAADNRQGARPLSLYFHLPFCESRCWYCGCTTIITRRKDWAFAYLEDLKREVALVAERVDCSRSVTQLHFGGGTPTFFPADALDGLCTLIHDHFTFADEAEVSVEIDPRRVSLDQIKVLRRHGFNRASLGIQDTNGDVQRAINRVQPQEQNERVVDWLRAEGFGSVSLDLIYGLPLQTPESVARTLKDALALNPDRLSVFSYAHVPWIKPAQRIFEKRSQLPEAQEKLAMFATLRQGLREAGYVDIGLDHFARPDDELAQARATRRMHRNFQGYSTHAGASLYAFGLSAISQTDEVYRQNYKTMAEYRAALDAGRLPVERGYRMTTEDQRRRLLIMSVMCERMLDFGRLRARHGIDVWRDYRTELDRLAPMIADNLVRLDRRGLEVLPAGEPLLRVVAMAFDEKCAPTVQAHALSV